MPASKKRRNKAGRKSNPDAKRKQTTAAGQGRGSGPTPELILRRRELTGDGGISSTLPLLALHDGVWISQDMYDAAWEFAMDAWAYFGPPDSCASTYEKLVAGFFDNRGAPRVNIACGTCDGRGMVDAAQCPDCDGGRRDRKSQRRYKRAVEVLIRPGESRRTFNQVVRITRDLQFPSYVVKVLRGRNPTSWEAKDFGRLIDGLARLARLRNRGIVANDQEAA